MALKITKNRLRHLLFYYKSPKLRAHSPKERKVYEKFKKHRISGSHNHHSINPL